MLRSILTVTAAALALAAVTASAEPVPRVTTGGAAFDAAKTTKGKAATAQERANLRRTEVQPRSVAEQNKFVTIPSAVTIGTSGQASWMHDDVAMAWSQGYTGRGTSITMVDDFKSGRRFSGNFGGRIETLTHGEWTRKEASMVAKGARIYTKDYYGQATVVRLQRGFNAINLSYGVYAKDGLTNLRWGAQEGSVISYAKYGNAVVVKAAGNDAVAVGSANASGNVDYLNRDLIGAASVIFAGALSSNGSATAPAPLASYSNFAGTNTTVQNQFLVVGVDGSQTGLYGTSFAAPVITGYSAILSSKFTKATPKQVVNQLLSTARTDTIAGYDITLHGKGEASLSRALAPLAIQ